MGGRSEEESGLADQDLAEKGVGNVERMDKYHPAKVRAKIHPTLPNINAYATESPEAAKARIILLAPVAKSRSAALCSHSRHAEIWEDLIHSVQMQVLGGGGICTTRGSAPTVTRRASLKASPSALLAQRTCPSFVILQLPAGKLRHGDAKLILEEEVLAGCLLLLVLDRVELVDTRAVVGRVATHRHLERGKEAVHTGEQRLGTLGGRLDGWLTLVDNHAVGEVGGHDDVVLDDHGRLARVDDEALDDARRNDTLLRVEVRRRLVDQIDIRRLTQRQHQRHTLQLTTRQRLHIVVNDRLDRHRLHHIGLELRVHERRLDLLEQQHAHRALELGRNRLRLERHVELRRLLGTRIGLELACKHLDERRLTRTVLAEEDDDLRVAEFTTLDVEAEAAERLGHGWARELGRPVQHLVVGRLGDLERKRLVAETHVLGGDVAVEEDVDAITDGRRHGHDTVHRGDAVEAADKVREVVEHGQVVLDGDDVGVGVEERADHARGVETLLDVEVRRGLVKHVYVGILDARHADGEALELSTGEVLDVAVENLLEVEHVDDLVLVVPLELAVEELRDARLALDGTRDVVDVLGLDERLDVVLEHLGEEVLELGAAEVLEDLLPVGRVVVAAEVGLLLARKDLERGRLADTVGADETEHLTGTRGGETVELERVGAVSVRGLVLEVGGQLDNVDGLEGALFGADTTADAERFGDEGDLARRRHLDTQTAHADDGTRLLALLTAFFGLALVRVDNGDTGLLLCWCWRHGGLCDGTARLVLFAAKREVVGATMRDEVGERWRRVSGRREQGRETNEEMLDSDRNVTARPHREQKLQNPGRPNDAVTLPDGGDGGVRAEDVRKSDAIYVCCLSCGSDAVAARRNQERGVRSAEEAESLKVARIATGEHRQTPETRTLRVSAPGLHSVGRLRLLGLPPPALEGLRGEVSEPSWVAGP
ncbi:hypothetical protein L1887_40498 [Cichorium endivia]|nr:hypothetical protein L1887_40498 [Cichorium endivia]